MTNRVAVEQVVLRALSTGGANIDSLRVVTLGGPYPVNTVSLGPIIFREDWPMKMKADPTQEWLAFGQELKARRDEVIRDGGYWLPRYVDPDGEGDKWVPLTEEMKQALLTGERPKLILRCPLCGIRENTYLGLEFAYELTSYCMVVHTNSVRCMVYIQDVKMYSVFARYARRLEALNYVEPEPPTSCYCANTSPPCSWCTDPANDPDGQGEE